MFGGRNPSRPFLFFSFKMGVNVCRPQRTVNDHFYEKLGVQLNSYELTIHFYAPTQRELRLSTGYPLFLRRKRVELSAVMKYN